MKNVWRKIGLVEAQFENSNDKFILPIALKLRERWLESVAPAFDEFDSPLAPLAFGQEGRRGKRYYLNGTVDVLIYLVEERGKRSIRTAICKLTFEQCKLIEETARQAWTEGEPPRRVEKLLESLDLTVISSPP